MASQGNDATDEPVTPAGRLFLRPEMDQIINVAVGFQDLPDVASVRSTLVLSAMIAHPRFSSLLVRDRRGRQLWRQTEIDLDSHIIVHDGPLGASACDGGQTATVSDEQAVNDYLADLSLSSPLSTDKPLWEVHILGAHKCMVLRVHHALGDGISLMTLFLACCRSAADPDRLPEAVVGGRLGPGGSGFWKRVWIVVQVIWFTLIYVTEFIGRSLWVRDRKTTLLGGAGVELWPRKLVTARFRLDDMKAVKKALPNLTINDVLFGAISSGFSRYLDARTPKALPEGLQITGLAMVNLRKQAGLQELSDFMKSKSGSNWGNKFGVMLLPVFYHKGSGYPLQYLKRAKAMIDRKKLSLEAQLSYKIGHLVMSCFGSKAAFILNYRIVCNTTFAFSNVIGPPEDIMFAGNRVTYLRVNSSALPHAITMHVLSYAGRADMQILVARDIIPDPQFLAKCFEDALLELKDAATAQTQNNLKETVS